MDGDDLNEVAELFERAIVSEDEAFVLAEERLRRAGSDGAAVARQRLDHPDPVGRLTARVVIDWAEAGDELDRARRYLTALPRRFAGTAAVTPPVRGVVDNLSARFGGRLADFLALHLVKESQPEDWQVLTVLQYLDRHKSPAASEALIRFAVRTPHRGFQQMAAQVLRNSGDPALAQKLAAETRRLAAQRGTLPPALASLATSIGSTA